MDNSLSSYFFEFISPAEPVSEAGRERFESEHFIEFGPRGPGEFRRRQEQIRKKSVSRALALSTAIFVVSGASKAASIRLDDQAKMADSARRGHAADGEAVSFDASGAICRRGRNLLWRFLPERGACCRKVRPSRNDFVGFPVNAKGGAGPGVEGKVTA